ncbi:hypothetical protein GCM10009682_49010 [Luedemannella flava]|uniref:Integral membrane protein n=1 Tax=Luedemannella flava TaxID=349316 RepID=A0ABP4YMC9_9ACTN
METGQWGAGSWAEDGHVPDQRHPYADQPPPRPASIYPPEPSTVYPAEPPSGGFVPDPRTPISPFPEPQTADPRTANPRGAGQYAANPYPAHQYPADRYAADAARYPADPRVSGSHPANPPGVDPRGGGSWADKADNSWLNPYPGDRSGAWSHSGARPGPGEPSGSWRTGAYPGEDLSLPDGDLTAGGGGRPKTYGRPRQQKGAPKVGGHPPRAGDGYPVGLRPVSATPVYRGSFPMRRINPVITPVAEQPDYRRATIYTFAWYGVPILLYLAWALTLEANRRSFVLQQLGVNFVWLLSAAALSLLLGVALRWVAHEWRNLTVSFAAAVMGSGFVTVIHTLVTGS